MWVLKQCSDEPQYFYHETKNQAYKDATFIALDSMLEEMLADLEKNKDTVGLIGQLYQSAKTQDYAAFYGIWKYIRKHYCNWLDEFIIYEEFVEEVAQQVQEEEIKPMLDWLKE